MYLGLRRLGDRDNRPALAGFRLDCCTWLIATRSCRNCGNYSQPRAGRQGGRADRKSNSPQRLDEASIVKTELANQLHTAEVQKNAEVTDAHDDTGSGQLSNAAANVVKLGSQGERTTHNQGQKQ